MKIITRSVFSKAAAQLNLSDDEVRCRYHGGKSTGAHSPRVKHGYYTKSAIEEREWVRALLKGVDDLLDEMVD